MRDVLVALLIVALLCVGGGWLFWRHDHDEKARAVVLARASYQAASEISTSLDRIGRSLGSAPKRNASLEEAQLKFLRACRKCASAVACERDDRDIQGGRALSSFNPCED